MTTISDIPGCISCVVCVEYDDLLEVTLERNARHFIRSFVITTPQDQRTQEIASRHERCYTHLTEAFYLNGDHFNKGRAIDDLLCWLDDRRLWYGWCCHWDADIVLPKSFSNVLRTAWPETIMVPQARRICEEPVAYTGQDDWSQWPVMREHPFDGGWCQLFHRHALALAQRPFYPREWSHAGNSDTFFAHKWPEASRRVLDCEVLHLGLSRMNWHGRTTPRANGDVPQEAEQRATWMAEMRTKRLRCLDLNHERTKP